MPNSSIFTHPPDSAPVAETNAAFFYGSFSTASIIESVVDPFIAVGLLFASAYFYEVVPDSHYVILALLTFSLTFPGDSHLCDGRGTMVRRTALNWLLIAGALVLFGYVTGYIHYFALPVLAVWLVGTPLALIAAHAVSRVALPRLMSRAGTQRRAVIVGSNDIAMQLARGIEKNPFLGVHLLGFFDDRTPQRTSGTTTGVCLGCLRDLAAYTKEQAVDHIYIALPMVSQPRILRILDDMKDTTASIFFVPDMFVTDLIQGRVDHVAGTPVVAVCETPFTGVNRLVKRLSDIVLASAILILIAPLMVLIAIGVKLGSPGPVIFKQNRYGLDGRKILVYKFRSMTVCEDGPQIVQAVREDPRVTRFGAWLRRTSLDELPQFINVLQGRMSIVGPRPHAVAHNETYRQVIKGYMIRHKVKPGITGWAQVNGCRGETDTVEKMARRIEYDLDYLRHWSLSLDLKIILMTIRLVIRDAHAY
ncbi:undecaprenyl-phosphate glucose phosphotransferase [Aromatoleum buckelii]|uniref:undecaprenyl-phosphate glucose phosphotransferase n=1 Tax=Aromatoleum buckelii TaxID=200254 RepID=UPI001FF37539|nr:undecaprenyl-phosphate glucose phosphotransferase [Aromatoleum buckelii]MCK0512951.1 undecaprenyl-phosphate glucose phosphotransferase [Aromatoleum buckelii]